jgi:signal transduction histidine kinase/DNA-binding LacI/PurR family transcriptional regulator/AraC-like DNA-binding protein/ActR/RegA family two-component response regulator
MTTQPAHPYTIGYLASSMEEGNGRSLWLSIKEAAWASGARLVTFAGAELRYPEPFYHHANQVYGLVDRQRLDGLVIWSSSLAGFIGPEGMRKFCQQYSPLPMVGIGLPLPGIPTVILDSYQGMRAAMLHLVQVHGRRRIAFLCGPEPHHDVKERLRAYRDVVAEFGLDANPDLISPPCDWFEEYAAPAMRVLMEERRVQFDGLVAINDELAYGAMVYMRGKGLRLPEDVAVIGFDNSSFGRLCTPPLTTVPNHNRERGRQAVHMLLARINGEAVPEVVSLPTAVIVRQSCGCRDPYIIQANQPPATLPASLEKASPTELRSYVITQLQKATIEKSVPGWSEKLFDAFVASLDHQAEEPFLSELQELLQSATMPVLELREWQTALTELRRWIVPLEQGRVERLEHAERLLQQARLMIGEIVARAQGHQEWWRSRQLNNLLQLRQETSAAETLEHLVDILARELPRLGIISGCMARYLDSANPLAGARLVLAFNESGRLPEVEGQVFTSAAQLAPPVMLNLPPLFNLVIHPLNIGAEQLGFFIVEASAFDASGHTVLRDQISTALKNVLLIEQNIQLYQQARQSQQLAEEANSLKSRFLSMVSHELLTPIVLLVGLSEMMLREGTGHRPPLPESYRQDLTRIHASAQQLGGLVRDVLDLARSQVGQLTLTQRPVYLADVLKPVELVSEQLARSKGLTWQVSIPEHLPLVMGDASRLQQVAFNLIRNAVKFTAQGSVTLTVEIGIETVTVAVTDTGLSVPLSEQEAIFDEFRQSERTVARGYGGLGIGLAICRQIIELHQGKIGVHSSGEENSGSTFYFTLPTLPDSASMELREPSQVVLILTEQITRSLSLRQHLERQGFQVQVLDIVQTSNWLDELLVALPGALVLDLPAAQRSWEIIDILKKNPATQDLPILFYSLLQEQDSGSMLALDYLAKPLAADGLAQALQRYGVTPAADCEQRTVLVVDDDPEILALHARLVEEHLPECRVLCAPNGRAALEQMHAHPPALVLLDLMMPEMDGMAVLNAMQTDKRLQGIPVIVLTAQRLSGEEMALLNQGVVAVLGKGLFTAAETLAHIEHALARHKRLGSENQRLVRKVMAYLHENFAQPVSREQLAQYATVSERHLNRCFMQETGTTPLTYLNRYRIQQARKLLEEGLLSVTEVMGQVGFSENSYFTRLFRREVGVSPSAYKKGARL